MSVVSTIIELTKKGSLMNIYSIKLEINNGVSEETISPIYEVHSWAKAEEIINATKALLADKPNSSFSFEVYGNHTTYIA